MDTSKEVTDEAILTEGLTKKVLKRNQRIAKMKLRMKASGAFKSAIIWLSYQWLDLSFFLLTIIFTMAVFGVLAKIIWEIWKVIFQVSL